MIFTVTAILIFSGYVLLITTISIGWWKLKNYVKTDGEPKVRVSVIVAVRNESPNINSLLTCLTNQDYPAHLCEIIIVDDHSSDTTSLLVQEFASRLTNPHLVQFIKLKDENYFGKKVAIHSGITASAGELLVITDADCMMHHSWIRTIASYYSEHQPQMILGPVRMTDGGNFFGKLQSLEFVSLIASAAGSCRAGFPILANGANIAFTRSAYESCGGFSQNMNFLSGDDMFLMMSIKKKFGARAIRFLLSEDAIVNTPATLEFMAFVQQRLRWVSKSRGYNDTIVIFVSILVFLTNVMLVAAVLAAIVHPRYVGLLAVLYLIKVIVDFPLLLGYSRFQKNAAAVWFFPAMELANAMYTLFVGIAGNIGKYEWKGRKQSANVP